MQLKTQLKLTLPLLIAGLCQAQLVRWVGTTGDVVLAAAATTLTIQQPATGAKAVTLETATIYCSVACDITQKQNGTGATATSATLIPITSTLTSPVTTLFRASNVGSGTALGFIYHLAAGAYVVFDLSKVSLPNTSSIAVNYSISISAITGTANVTIIGTER